MMKTRCTPVLLTLLLVAALGAGAAAQSSLTTIFAGNNGNAGNMFDVRSVGPSVQITDFDINLSPGSTVIEVWIVTGGGTLVGNETNAAAWSLVASVPITSNGADVPTPLGLASDPSFSPILIPAGQTQGFCIIGTNLALDYTNGSAFGSPADRGDGTFATDGTIEVLEGYGMAYDSTNLQPNFTGTLNGNPATGDSRIWNGTVYYLPVSGLADDLYVTGISSPVDSVSCDPLTSTEIVEMSIVSLGSNTLIAGSAVDFKYSIDGAPQVVETVLLPSDLNLGDSYTHTFATPADLSALGGHTVDVEVFYIGDLDPSNDTASKTVFSGSANVVNTFPWFENFDSAPSQNSTVLPAGWEQDQNDGTGTSTANKDWYMHTGTTSSSNTGPADDITGGGYYAYVEDAGNHPFVNMISPCIDLSAGGMTNPTLGFYAFSHNSNPSGPNTNENFISVDIISFPGGVTNMDVITPIGDQGAADWASADWVLHTVDLTAFLGQTIRVQFRGSSDNGGVASTLYHDIAIDQVAVGEPQIGLGQPGRPGLALLDLNNAASPFILQGGPDSGDNGPFVTTVAAGDAFDFSFEGEPNQPFAWLAGSLNPAVATFPGTIGQFDIGTTLNPSTGIPIDIAVIGDGFNPFDFISGLCRLGVAGTTNFTLNNTLPPGFVATFQCAMGSTMDQGGGVFTAFVAMSNAVELTVQ